VVGYFLFVAQYLQLVLGLSPLEAGAWSLPSAIAMVVGSNVGPRLVRRFRPATVMGIGLAMAAVGLALLTQVGSTDGLVPVVAASIVISLGLAPVFGLTTELIVGAAPPERAGAATGISETGSELGGALGISVLGSIGVAIYRGQVADELPAQVPASAANAVRDTLGAATGVAQQLPDALGTVVLDVARGAFVSGMQVVAAISVAIAVGVAILTFAALRHVPPRGDGDEADTQREPSEAPLPQPAATASAQAQA
jgi:DHA2 family multidrug resistance protein-like MFS transporter